MRIDKASARLQLPLSSGCFTAARDQVVSFADLPQDSWIACSANVCWTSGASHSNVTPCHSVENCPDRTGPPGIRLQHPADRARRLYAPGMACCAWTPISVALTTISFPATPLPSHVVDQSGERVAQGDTGVGPGAIVPLRSEIDVSGAAGLASMNCASRSTTGRPARASLPATLQTDESERHASRCITSASAESFRTAPV